MEAITRTLRARRESSFLARASSASAGPVPRSWFLVPRRPPEDLLGGDPSLKRSVSADAALSEKSPYLGSAWVRLAPTTRPYQRQGDRAGASLGGKHPHTTRIARKLHPSQSLISERRPGPAEPQNTPSGAGSVRNEPWRRSSTPLAQRAKAQSFPEPPQRAEARSRRAPKHVPAKAVLLQALNNSPDSAHQRLTQRVFIEVETRADPLPETTKNNKQTHL